MIHPLIARRRSIRAFSDRKIDNETLLQLFEAARWAPSSLNEQPWRFIVAVKQDKENFDKILSCLNESNQVWAQHSAALFVTLAKKSFTEKKVMNSHALHDVGLAVSNLSLQATAMDLFLHQMGGINREKIRSVFEIPDDFEIVSVIAGGYKGSPESLPENLRQREVQQRNRKNLDELIFSGTFGGKSSIQPSH